MSTNDTLVTPDYWKFHPSIATKAVVGIMAVMIFLGNAGVCYLIVKNRQLRSSTNFFVFSLALADIFVAVLLIPSFLAELEFFEFFSAFSSFATLTNLVGCTFDRYFAIMRPLDYRALHSRRYRVMLVALCWVTPIILTCVPMTWMFASSVLVEKKLAMTRNYTAFLVTSVILLNLCVVHVYVSLFVVARKHARLLKGRQNQFIQSSSPEHRNAGSRLVVAAKAVIQELKSVKLFFLVALVVIFSWLPLIYNTLVADVLMKTDWVPPALIDVSAITWFSHSLFNPIIYAFYQEDIRQRLRRMLGCCKRKGRKTTQLNRRNSLTAMTSATSVTNHHAPM